MKFLLTSTALLMTSLLVSANSTELNLDKEKERTDPKKEVKTNATSARNFHSIKKWKIIIEFKNGKTIHKFITAQENSKVSAMDMAFEEAEEYLKTLKTVRKVVGYSVIPVSENSYVLLAGN